MYCENHPQNETVGMCVSCGREVCAVCKVKFKESIYCMDCIESGRIIGMPPRGIARTPYLEALSQRFQAQGYTITTMDLEEFNVTIAHGKSTVMAMSTLENFVVMAESENVTEEMVWRLSMLGSSFAAGHKTIRFPMFTGLVVTYVVLAGLSIQEDAKRLALAKPKYKFGYPRIPVLVDITTKEVHFFMREPFVGWALWRAIRNFLTDNFQFGIEVG
jgi:hypothetical protein